MAHNLTVAECAYIEARLDDIERDPLGYTTKGELRRQLTRLLAGAPGYSLVEIDTLRMAVGLPPIDAARAAANRAAIKAGVAMSYDGVTCNIQTRLNPLCTGAYPTRADLYPGELAAARNRLAAFVHALAAEGFDIRPSHDVAVNAAGFVDQRMTLVAADALELAA